MEKKTIIKLVASAVTALLVLIVIVQNVETVDTRIFFWTMPMPRIVLLFLMLVIGFALGMTAAFVYFSPKPRRGE